MSKIKCFDVFKMVASGLSEDVMNNYEVNEAKLSLLEKECNALDAVSDESNGVGFEVDISEDTLDISISLDFTYIIIVDRLYPEFLDIIQENTKSMRVQKTDTEDILRITFVFNSIWD